VAKIDWQRAEWADDERVLDVFLGGVMVTVAPHDDNGDWVWTVRATSEVSEHPELYDCGTAPTESAAKGAAVKSGRKAAQSYAARRAELAKERER